MIIWILFAVLTAFGEQAHPDRPRRPSPACSFAGAPLEADDAIVVLDGAQERTPNQPPGFVKLSERGFDAMEEDGWGVHSKNVHGSIEHDEDVPVSPSSVYQMWFPAGEVGGGGDLNRLGRGIAREGSFQELYISFAIKHSENWQGHRSGVNKILFLGAAGYQGRPLVVVAHGGRGQNTLRPRINLQGQDNSVCGYNRTLNARQNRNQDRQFVKGRWHLVEVYAKLNTEGQCDGVVRMWLDGYIVVAYDDVVLLDRGESPRTWTKLNLDPIWGGTRDTVRQDMWKRIDHFVISGR